MNALSYILEITTYVVLSILGVAVGFLITKFWLRERRMDKKMEALFESFEQKKDKE